MDTQEREKHSVIRTGLYLIDEDSGGRLAVCMCSIEQNGGTWLEEESNLSGRTVECRLSSHGRQPIRSLEETLMEGELIAGGDDEAAVLIYASAILGGLRLLRTAGKKPAKVRKAS